jgi:hypothetical protein
MNDPGPVAKSTQIAIALVIATMMPTPDSELPRFILICLGRADSGF